MARGQDGQTVLFPIVETVRNKGIVQWAFIPTQLDVGIAQELRRISNEVTQNIQYKDYLKLALQLRKMTIFTLKDFTSCQPNGADI